MALRGKTLREKLDLNVVRDGECLRWQGHIGGRGYGRLRFKGVTTEAHRVAHEVFIGAIPDGLEIDHVFERGCRFKDCVNPDHLEAVTHEENMRRIIDRITHCPRNHEYTDENSQWESNGRKVVRRCKTCRARPDGIRVAVEAVAA